MVKRPECVPRFMTPRSPERATLGGRVADIAAVTGKPLLWHQRLIADVALEIDPATGLLAYGSVTVIVMRQNGKSELLFPVMTHRSLGFDKALTGWIRQQYGVVAPLPGPQRTLYLAQGADQARAKWRDVHLARIQKSPLSQLLIEARLRQNQEMMVFANGSTWLPGSATAKSGGTGDTLDLGMIDEGWAHDSRTELGLRPTMLTRPWRQLWTASMIPGPQRKKPHEWPWLRDKITAGRASVEAGVRSGTCYIEFGAQPGMDPYDPDTWYSCMPALGLTVSERAVSEDLGEFGLADFEAEYLGWEPQVSSPRWQVVSELVWTARKDPSSEAADPVALAIEAASDQSIGVIGAAGLRGGDVDRVHVEVIERLPGISWIIDRVIDIATRQDLCAIAINPSGGAASLLEPLERALLAADVQVPVIRPTSRDVAVSQARLVMFTGTTADQNDDEDAEIRPDRRLSHLGQPELDRSLGSSVRKYTGTQWRFEPGVPGADPSPIRAVALAVWAGDRVEWAGESYDIASSLG